MIVFAVSVVSKLRTRFAWREFEAATSELLGVGANLGRVLGASTAACEAVTVITVLIDPLARVGALIALGLALSLLLVVFQGVLRRVVVTCNCFGASGDELAWAHVWRNVLLVFVAALGVIGSRTASVPSLIPSASASVPIVLGVFVAVALIAWEDFVFLVGPRMVVRRPGEA